LAFAVVPHHIGDMKAFLFTKRFAPLVLALVLALAPALADARPGGGLSFGSRGSRTYSSAPGTSTAPGGAGPLQNSITPNGAGGGYGSSYGGGYGRSSGGFGGGFGGGMRPRSAFASGLMGGLIGAGIGGMLFGRGFFGGLSGGGSLLGLMLQLFILYMIGRWLYRRYAGGPALAGAGMFNRSGPAQGGFARPGFLGGGASRPALTLTPADYASFDQLLHGIQAAWTAHDLNGLRAMTTPEMVGTFAEQLAEQTSRGVRNQVSDVRLLKGDLSEAWSEGSREYATVAMRFAMIDVTRDGGGRVVDGSLTERVTVTELWTFLRAPGGRWVLSAIQQPR
jgi:hypothetical protein